MHLDTPGEPLYGQSEPAREFLVRKEQTDRQRCVTSDWHGAFRIADEPFAAQMLSDCLEEQLDVPASLYPYQRRVLQQTDTDRSKMHKRLPRSGSR